MVKPPSDSKYVTLPLLLCDLWLILSSRFGTWKDDSDKETETDNVCWRGRRRGRKEGRGGEEREGMVTLTRMRRENTQHCTSQRPRSLTRPITTSAVAATRPCHAWCRSHKWDTTKTQRRWKWMSCVLLRTWPCKWKPLGTTWEVAVPGLRKWSWKGLPQEARSPKTPPRLSPSPS